MLYNNNDNLKTSQIDYSALSLSKNKAKTLELKCLWSF